MRAQVGRARAARTAAPLPVAAAGRPRRRLRRRVPAGAATAARSSVLFFDLRGFTSFAETSEPEEVMAVLGEFHAVLGRLVHAHDGTLERFTGDGVMVFFNDPLPCDDPAGSAVRLALAVREQVRAAAERWSDLGHDLAPGRRHRPGLRHARAHRLRGPLRLRRHRQRHEPGGPAVRGGGALAGPGQPARPAGRGGPGRLGPGRGPAAARLQPSRPRVRRPAAARRRGEPMTTHTPTPVLPAQGRTLADLDDDERYRRFDELQAPDAAASGRACGSTWPTSAPSWCRPSAWPGRPRRAAPWCRPWRSGPCSSCCCSGSHGSGMVYVTSHADPGGGRGATTSPCCPA